MSHFTISHGKMWIQKDGVEIGSDLGPISVTFILENNDFNTINKPYIYLKYVDDILFLTDSTDKTNIIQETFRNNSVFNFT